MHEGFTLLTVFVCVCSCVLVQCMMYTCGGQRQPSVLFFRNHLHSFLTESLTGLEPTHPMVLAGQCVCPGIRSPLPPRCWDMGICQCGVLLFFPLCIGSGDDTQSLCLADLSSPSLITPKRTDSSAAPSVLTLYKRR